MQDQILKMAGQVSHPFAISIIAIFVAVMALVLLLRAKRPFTAWALAAVIIVLGLAPVAASRLVQSRGVYRVRLVVLRPDQSLADIAQVKSSNGGDLKMVDGGWELDIPSQLRPADGKVAFSATVKDEFLQGKSSLVLAQDYYPTSTIQLVADTSAKLRGVVVDEGLVAVEGAKVSIEGYPEVALTDKMGSFVLAAHAGKGQTVEVRAQKGPLSGRQSVEAGKTVEVIIQPE
jgi:predicted ribosome-associated RNA-binding protein Tma20